MSPSDVADKRDWSAAKEKWAEFRLDIPTLAEWHELPEHVRLAVRKLITCTCPEHTPSQPETLKRKRVRR